MERRQRRLGLAGRAEAVRTKDSVAMGSAFFLQSGGGISRPPPLPSETLGMRFNVVQNGSGGRPACCIRRLPTCVCTTVEGRSLLENLRCGIAALADWAVGDTADKAVCVTSESDKRAVLNSVGIKMMTTRFMEKRETCFQCFPAPVHSNILSA